MHTTTRACSRTGALVAVLALTLAGTPVMARTAVWQTPATPPSQPPSQAAAGVALPADYVIGAEDVLSVNFWRDQEMSGDVTVRPDGKVTLPLVGDIQAAGLTPDALGDAIRKAATKFIDDPTVTVIVKTINSRKVFVTGEVARPGAYPLLAPMTVMQVIALAGGLTEFADKGSIAILRVENGQTRSFRFNYKDVAKGKALSQNIVLKPGDTVVVP